MEMTTDLRHFLSGIFFKPLLKAVFTNTTFSTGFKDKKSYSLCA